MDIKNSDLTSLKSTFYDLMVERNRIERMMQILETEIENRSKVKPLNPTSLAEEKQKENK